MRLPNAEKAFVEEPKLGYLLRAEEKGGFFEAVGFSASEPETLRDALLGHARRQEVSRTLQTPFGVKYVLDGPLKSPDGRDPERVDRGDRGRPAQVPHGLPAVKEVRT